MKPKLPIEIRIEIAERIWSRRQLRRRIAELIDLRRAEPTVEALAQEYGIGKRTLLRIAREHQ